MSNELIFFDLASKGNPDSTCWSSNTWKTRAALNYKSILYKTEWVEFQDIIPKFKDLGLPPNPAGSFAEYTVPVIRWTDGSYTMGSELIAEKLEKTKPEPSLRLNPGLEKEVGRALGPVFKPLIPYMFPRIRRNLAPEGSQDWFKTDRERRLGAPEEVYEKERGGDVAWNAAAPAQEKLATFLKEKKKDDGPFLTGSKVCYADFIIAAACEMFERLADGSYEKFVDPVSGLRELHQACKPWFERNKH